MPTRFEHRATFSAPPAEVAATLTDRAFLEERQRELGGKGAALLEHAVDGDEVRFRLRQGVDAERLPSMARAIIKGDLMVERAERWGPDGSTAQVTLSGVPGGINSRGTLTGRPDGGTELALNAEVRVGLPLVGGKLERVIADEVAKLLAKESEFAGKWLAEHGS
ncbi:MAG TPA: DUF2505 domain-containing protein [Actinophytocola sp.]|uniref:DUF2505 domain-containing protein n=1 Tax=Actinophytocola sp. TaxID=1872138 RepID=UPI002DC035B6|nr:DUF2505 domain-containing protein [Actinophytocola sp.]HEU5469789.1 DUF2505 domain-containing protein [Actinophytocola sp.]